MSKNILAVDDSPSMREMISFTLRNAGYEVIEAVDGSDALPKIAKGGIDLVITDLNMPNLDGISLIRKIRQSDACKYVPVIMLTTESQAEKKQAGREAGATGWIVKPFQSQQLIAVARRFLG